MNNSRGIVSYDLFAIEQIKNRQEKLDGFDI